jgi:hydroxymethylpyrimidine pyrophosphatase-like HAD family hydrolase
MNRLAGKAQALALIADHLGIQPAEVMAIGDSFNDLDMIKWPVGGSQWAMPLRQSKKRPIL